MQVTFQGNPLILKGTQLKIGDQFPNISLTTNNLNSVSTQDLKGTRVFLTVPSLDTPVCDTEVRRFNQEAAQLEGVSVYAVSLDLPFAQARWCGAAGINKVQTLSDYQAREFGQATGTFIKELALLTRAVIIVNENNEVTYVEYLSEITNEPNYEAALNALK